METAREPRKGGKKENDLLINSVDLENCTPIPLETS